MSDASSSTLAAARTSSGYVVRVLGRGTMKVSPAFHRFLLHCLEREEGCEAVVDLLRCDYLDSTFLGCLIDLHKKWRNAPGSFALAVSREGCERLLAPMQLDKVFRCAGSVDDEHSEWLSITTDALELRDLACHVLDCHRRLVEMGGRAQKIYEPVVASLAQELDELDAEQTIQQR